MRKIPMKNYLLLFILLAVSAFVVLLIFNLFDTKKKENSSDFKQLNFEELDNYIVENPDVIIYFTTTDSIQNKYYKKFKEFVNKNYITNNVIFIDNKDISDKDFSKFINKYLNKDTNITTKDYLIIMDEQKIYTIIPIDNENPNMDIIKNILIEIGVL